MVATSGEVLAAITEAGTGGFYRATGYNRTTCAHRSRPSIARFAEGQTAGANR